MYIHERACIVDVDECKDANGGCDTKRACINLKGSRECGSCADGWKVDGETSCAGPCYLLANS